MRNFISTILVLIIFWGCTKGPDDPYDPGIDLCGSYVTSVSNIVGNISTHGQIFENAQKIDFIPYTYSYNGNVYNIDLQHDLPTGDVCSFFESISIHADAPQLIVPAVNSNLVAVAISTSPLQRVNGKNSISNTASIVWTWNSGISSATIENGNYKIKYADGRMVTNGEIQANTTVTTLLPGRIYYLSMWAWDSNGLNIAYSSASVPFMVTSRLFDYSYYSNFIFLGDQGFESPLISDIWNLESAVDIISNADITSSITPTSFYIHYIPCDSVKSYQLWFVEDGMPKKITFSDYKYIKIEGSVLFTNTLEMQFACSQRLIFTTQIGNRMILFTYSRS